MKRMFFTLLLLLMTAGGIAAAEADQYFATGAQLLEDHCSECEGATRAGFEAGIASLRQAIAAGYADQAAAYKLIARAYNVMVMVYAANDTEQALFLSEQATVFQQLVAIAPNDADARLEYAKFLSDDAAARLPHAQAAATLAPQSAEAQYVLAVTLIEVQRYEDSMTAAHAAIEYAYPEVAGRYAHQLSEMYAAAGMTAESTAILDEARRKNG